METLSPIVLMLLQLTAVLGLLLLADRWLHRHLQGVMLLLTGDPEIALWLYAIVLFPGVLLHELSHAIVAALAGVKIGRINVLPRRVGKRIQLGFVPVEHTDFIRASLIGAAPLLFGSAAVIALGYRVFGTPEVLSAIAVSDWLRALRELAVIVRTPDMWFWAYLLFTIGNTMLPSRSDVHAWPVLGLAFTLLVFGIAVVGGADLLLDGAGRMLTLGLRMGTLLGASIFLADLPFFLVIVLVQKLIERIRGVRLEFRDA